MDVTYTRIQKSPFKQEYRANAHQAPRDDLVHCRGRHGEERGPSSSRNRVSLQDISTRAVVRECPRCYDDDDDVCM